MSSQVVDLVFTGVLFFLFPESQILLEQLDDALGVAEVFLLEFIDLVKSFLEGFISEVASRLVVLHHFVMEHREIEGQAELDWVAWWEGDIISVFV